MFVYICMRLINISLKENKPINKDSNVIETEHRDDSVSRTISRVPSMIVVNNTS